MPTKSRIPAIVLLTCISLIAACEAKASSHKAQAHKKSTANRTLTHGKHTSKRASRTAPKKKAASAKVRRLSRAFVASADLKKMARQLVENRTPAGYRAVGEYARRHAGTDAGALAWLTIGYSHFLDGHYPEAIAALEKAKPHAGELYDYVRYFEAVSYGGQGNSAKVAEMLRDFEREAPESIFQKDVIDIYGSALVSQGKTLEAITYLEAHRMPIKASVELALGKSYLHTDHPEKGMEILRRLYFTMPSSAEAAEAATQLAAAGSALEGSYSDEKTRADLLAKAGRWADAARAYRQLQSKAPAQEQSNLKVAVAAALRHLNNTTESRTLLEQVQASGEAEAQRLYLLCEIARSEKNESAVVQHLSRLRQQAATSPWFEQALLSTGNMYLLAKDYDHAIDMFRELRQRFQSSPRASYAHWKAAWLTYRQGRRDVAKKDFEDQVLWYPDRPEVPAALYWRARIAEDENDYTLARAWYAKLSDRFHNYYYGYLGRECLAKLPLADTGSSKPDPILARIPDFKQNSDALEEDPPPHQLRAEKSRLLLNAGLNEFAIRELQAEQGGQGASWATLQIARIYQESGHSHRAIQFLKKSLPGYYSFDIPALPRPYWEILFPRPHWTDVRRQSLANSLDPYLVASLIRQESEFNPGAVSHANAYGLMQLLPQVGQGEARAARIRHFSTASLLVPNLNIQLGTHYFKSMVTQFNGQVEYALAAYNAGSNRVEDWLQNGYYRDVPEFVESIPFTETREYVQAIMRNSRVYQRLYPQQLREREKDQVEKVTQVSSKRLAHIQRSTGREQKEKSD